MNNTQSNDITIADNMTTMQIISNLDRDSICGPIRNLMELSTFLLNPPQWLKHLISREKRSNTIVQNSSYNCHTIKGSSVNVLKRFDSQLTPRTLVCHDMKNGYLEDRYLGGTHQGNGYTFYRWAQIDIFVYFSHHFITIPPLAWINRAHANGVKILGTIITEHDAGKLLCKEFLSNYKQFADNIIQLTILCKMDGWLLNIENDLEGTEVMKQFVQYLTEKMHARVPESLIIWYDSVIEDGNLSWQNELNEKNRCFFDICDGIFLNYTYKEHNLIKSYENANHRTMDIYAGIDVFGRNTYGGGMFDCHIAANKIRSLQMSLAIFAPGWTHETLQPDPMNTFLERYIHKDNSFWRSLWPFLYTHPITNLFTTTFYIGADHQRYNLHDQELQLSRFLHSSQILDYDLTVSTLKNQCNCMQLEIQNRKASCILTKNNDNLSYLHHLFVCDILLQGSYIFYTATKAVKGCIHDLINITILFQENGVFRKIICYANEKKRLENNFTLKEINPTHLQRKIIHETELNDSTLRFYELGFINPCRLLDISAEIVQGDAVELRGIGMLSKDK